MDKNLRVVGAIACIALLALTGCGDFGATDEELAEARNQARQVGREEARANAERRIRQAHEFGYWDGQESSGGGWSRGWDEGWEAAEETIAEGGAGINPYPVKQNGEPSYEFEPEDIEHAEEADDSVREYCEGAASEAQEVGCLSHVEPWEVP